MPYLNVFWSVFSHLSILGISVAIACEAPFSPNSGIQGKVLVGPVCPVVQVGKDCADRPYQTALVVVNDRGTVIERINSDETGSFAVKLIPGTYTLKSAQQSNAPPFLKDQPAVTVSPNRMEFVTLHFDSGLR